MIQRIKAALRAFRDPETVYARKMPHGRAIVLSGVAARFVDEHTIQVDLGGHRFKPGILSINGGYIDISGVAVCKEGATFKSEEATKMH